MESGLSLQPEPLSFLLRAGIAVRGHQSPEFKLELEMELAISFPEFKRQLARMPSAKICWQEKERSAVLLWQDALSLSLCFVEKKPEKLGSLTLPRAMLLLGFCGWDQRAINHFQSALRQVLQRGGG